MNGVEKRGAYAALSAAVLFWGLSFVAVKMALETIPVFTLVFFRFGIAGCLFAIGCLLRGGFPRLPKTAHRRLLALAVFEPGLYFILETFGLRYTTAPKASLIIATIPVAVLVMGRVALGESISLVSILGVLVSLLGIGALVAGEKAFVPDAGLFLRGDLLILGAVITASFYIVWARDLGRRYSAWAITCYQVFYGSLFFVPFFVIELFDLNWAAVSLRSLSAAIYLTLFATVLAYLCYNYGLTKIEASKASVFINGIPVVTAFAAWVILGERLNGVQAMGGLMVLAGVWLTNSREKRAKVRGG